MESFAWVLTPIGAPKLNGVFKFGFDAPTGAAKLHGMIRVGGDPPIGAPQRNGIIRLGFDASIGAPRLNGIIVLHVVFAPPTKQTGERPPHEGVAVGLGEGLQAASRQGGLDQLPLWCGPHSG